MRKGDAKKIFLDRIAPTLREYGYEYKGRGFIRSFSVPVITIRIFPEFATHTGEMVFDIFIDISIPEYSEELRMFMISRFPQYATKDECMIMLELRDIEEHDRDYDDDLTGFIDFFIRSFNAINKSIEANFSNRRRFLGYLWKNRRAGGVNRTLAEFVLRRSCEGPEAASNWLRSGAPDTPSEYQRKQLDYLLEQYG